jgi:hypothetical protein
VTQLRAAIRKLLRALGRDCPAIAARAPAGLSRGDDYASGGKPPCGWDGPGAREVLVDVALVRDRAAALVAIDGESLDGAAEAAAELLAVVAGQDVDEDDDGVFRIARRVAADRVISTVDTEGPKTQGWDRREARKGQATNAEKGKDPTGRHPEPGHPHRATMGPSLLQEPPRRADVSGECPLGVDSVRGKPTPPPDC